MGGAKFFKGRRLRFIKRLSVHSPISPSFFFTPGGTRIHHSPISHHTFRNVSISEVENVEKKESLRGFKVRKQLSRCATLLSHPHSSEQINIPGSLFLYL